MINLENFSCHFSDTSKASQCKLLYDNRYMCELYRNFCFVTIQSEVIKYATDNFFRFCRVCCYFFFNINHLKNSFSCIILLKMRKIKLKNIG